MACAHESFRGTMHACVVMTDMHAAVSCLDHRCMPRPAMAWSWFMRGYGGGGGWREMPTKYSNKLRSEREEISSHFIWSALPVENIIYTHQMKRGEKGAGNNAGRAPKDVHIFRLSSNGTGQSSYSVIRSMRYCRRHILQASITENFLSLRLTVLCLS
jgi:hypothetical protein